METDINAVLERSFTIHTARRPLFGEGTLLIDHSHWLLLGGLCSRLGGEKLIHSRQAMALGFFSFGGFCRDSIA